MAERSLLYRSGGTLAVVRSSMAWIGVSDQLRTPFLSRFLSVSTKKMVFVFASMKQMPGERDNHLSAHFPVYLPALFTLVKRSFARVHQTSAVSDTELSYS